MIENKKLVITIILDSVCPDYLSVCNYKKNLTPEFQEYFMEDLSNKGLKIRFEDLGCL